MNWSKKLRSCGPSSSSFGFSTPVEDVRLDLGRRFCFQNSMYAAYFLLICTCEANLLHFYLSAFETEVMIDFQSQ
jgi:hypothetical protein